MLPWTWPVDLKALSEAPVGTVTFGFVPDYYPGFGRPVEFHNCQGVAVGGVLDQPRWQTVVIEPLTVAPSIWCKPPGGCGMHGWIREGNWVEA